MVDEEKWAINTVCVENFYKHDFVCKYNPSTGRYRECLRDEIGDKELNKGYYTKVNDLTIGVFATAKGPVFFYNDSRFLLEEGIYHMAVDEKTNKRIFCLTIDGRKVFEVEYEKPKYTNYDVWSDEEMTDFFIWLSKKNKNKFHEYYTIK